LQRSGTAVLLELMQRGFKALQADAHRGKQLETLVGDFHAPAVAPKQRYLDISLQRLDLLADCRRG